MGRRELHISLSRPIYLRAHEREDLKRNVRDIAKSHPPFDISFASFSELTNDEKTRTFLTLEIGAGHHELNAMSTSLSPILKTFRQKGYYDYPRFHSSIGWAILDPPASTLPDSELQPRQLDVANKYPSIPCFPDALVPTLVEKYHEDLSSLKIGVCPVTSLSVKIGKEVSTWHLVGTKENP